jgi:hypothetical protein
LNNLENLEEELKFFSELEDINKPMTVQAERPKKPQSQALNLANTAKKEVKTSLEFKRTQLYRTAVLTQPPNNKRDPTSNLITSSLEKKMVSDSELRKDR